MSNMYFTLKTSTGESNERGRHRQPYRRNYNRAMPQDVASLVDSLYRTEWGRIVAVLIKHFGDFDLAEEYAQEAFTAALTQWTASGVPDLPFAWLIQTARNKAIDRIRRQTVFAEKVQPELLHGATEAVAHPGDLLGEIPDERLRLIFTC